MSGYARIVALLLAAVALLGVGYRHGMEVKQGQIDAEAKAAKKAREELVDATANKLAAMAPTQAAITERVIREVKTNTVYRDCLIPDSGVRLLNRAISGAQSESSGGDGVQAASP